MGAGGRASSSSADMMSEVTNARETSNECSCFECHGRLWSQQPYIYVRIFASAAGSICRRHRHASGCHTYRFAAVKHWYIAILVACQSDLHSISNDGTMEKPYLPDLIASVPVREADDPAQLH